jgi:hypothetical protein
MQLTKKQRRVFNVIIAIATLGLIVSSLAGSLFYLMG